MVRMDKCYTGNVKQGHVGWGFYLADVVSMFVLSCPAEASGAHIAGHLFNRLNKQDFRAQIKTFSDFCVLELGNTLWSNVLRRN